MKRAVDQAIVLRRVDYGEADRIVSLLSRSRGKITLFARAVRKPKSKLAGGIELFALNEVTFIPGRGDMMTLVSAQVVQHFGSIVRDYDRTMLAYRLLKAVDVLTEDTADESYFTFLLNGLAALDDEQLADDKLMLWLAVRLLALHGSMPNVLRDTHGAELDPGDTYQFSFDDMGFYVDDSGVFQADTIKLLRLCASAESVATIKRVQADESVVSGARELAQRIAAEVLHVEL